MANYIIHITELLHRADARYMLHVYTDLECLYPHIHYCKGIF